MTAMHPPGLAQQRRQVREIEHVWIPMSDGVRLAGRIWLPEEVDAYEGETRIASKRWVKEIQRDLV